MLNPIIVFSESIDQWIAPRNEPYEFLISQPRKIGDQALIRVQGRDVRVMLVECRNTVKPAKWLVECA